VVAAIGLFIPAIFAATRDVPAQGILTEESVLVAGLLIFGYVLSLIYQFTNPAQTLGAHEPVEEHVGPRWSGRTATFVLLAAAGLLAVLSEILVGAIEPFIAAFGLSTFFVGVIVIPTIGNLAEHFVSVQLGFRNKMEFALAVTFGSSLQVALFVVPVLVILGALLGQPMDLAFPPLEVAAVAAAVAISALIALDGESNWLEGALLMIVYLNPGGVVLRALAEPEAGGSATEMIRQRQLRPAPGRQLGRRPAAVEVEEVQPTGLHRANRESKAIAIHDLDGHDEPAVGQGRFIEGEVRRLVHHRELNQPEERRERTPFRTEALEAVLGVGR
jgi:hypothetical protein